ncbi:MAG: hypothetical protein BWY47_00432 [Bacteroidetes bacterium ADurb.Bin302]|nr:MAG: hypothetical protein BWY47_00432 [Bacteroidetes bacterium ADurb.Bin302]
MKKLIETFIVGVVCAIVFFWVAVIVIASHFLAKIW